MLPWAGKLSMKALLCANIPRYGLFSKIEMKVHEQSFSFFPSSMCYRAEKNHMVWKFEHDLSQPWEACLGVQMQVQCWEDNGWVQGAVLISFSKREGLSSGCVVSAVLQGLWGKYLYKLHHSFIPLLAPPEDSKYFNSKGGQCFCNADSRRNLRAGWWGRVAVKSPAFTLELSCLGQSQLWHYRLWDLGQLLKLLVPQLASLVAQR